MNRRCFFVATAVLVMPSLVQSRTPVEEPMVEANGQLRLIADYPELFKIIGTKYGGDGVQTFRLPDKRCGCGAQRQPGMLQQRTFLQA